MEFKFRAVDGRSPAQLPSSSTIGFFSAQAFGANYPNIDPRLSPELMRNKTLQREIEKERIREEIIAKEIAWRVLQAEVRRELMMEREMAMRVGDGEGGGSTFGERPTMRLEPRPWFPFMNQFDNRRLEELSAFHGRGVFDWWLQSPRVSEALVAPVVKPALEDNKDKLIVLAKPDPNHCGAKRKAATPPEGGAAGLPYAGLKKKLKEDWSCALCQVSATSERGLIEHLRGKKHKAKEARLRANKMAKNPRSMPLPKNSTKPAKLATCTASLKLEAKVEVESLQVEESNNDVDEKTGNKQDPVNQNDKLQLLKNVHEKILKKNGAAKLQRKDRKAELRKAKKFKFWCEMCQIGAYSAVVMEAHRKGKKHQGRLAELNQNSEAVSTITTMDAKAGEKAKGTEKENEKMTESVNDNEKITETVADNEKILENVIADAETVCRP
ncbi:hypothetical protein P3X46_031748 [Hevea brasiliensis]|uniref:U1-type domain-containing protein n=2 Tax=Hevea brasiliensis TaxID=3981 RepID=A0ABQ9KLD0_HEVBR|nr:hypothetical protein P3X46_031748 [Hevea brasiliensis]